MSFDWHTLVGIIAVVMQLLLFIPYVRSILHDTTRPSPVSWFGWALLFAIATLAQASKGVDWSLSIPLIATFSTTAIAIIALRVGRVAWTRVDKICIVFALLAIVLWLITQEPLAALVLSVIADIFVSFPTLVKTYREPASEPLLLWMLYTTATLLAIIATTDLTIYNLLVPVEGAVVDIIITLLILRRYMVVRPAEHTLEH